MRIPDQLTQPKTELSHPRVLARVLAEDLRNVSAGGATTQVSEPPGGNRDITNVGGDGDLI
jgi:hypothetical protein